MKTMPELKVVKVPTDELLEYENNAKLHPSDQIDQLAASIEEFGFNAPILAWHNDDGEPEIVSGHGRLMAARELGLTELPVVFLDHMSDEQRRAYILVDNQLTMNSGFDFALLDNELTSITNIDMSDFGFNLDGIMNDMEMDEFFIEAVQDDDSSSDDESSDNAPTQSEESNTSTAAKTFVCPHCGKVIEL